MSIFKFQRFPDVRYIEKMSRNAARLSELPTFENFLIHAFPYLEVLLSAFTKTRCLSVRTDLGFGGIPQQAKSGWVAPKQFYMVFVKKVA